MSPGAETGEDSIVGEAVAKLDGVSLPFLDHVACNGMNGVGEVFRRIDLGEEPHVKCLSVGLNGAKDEPLL